MKESSLLGGVCVVLVGLIGCTTERQAQKPAPAVTHEVVQPNAPPGQQIDQGRMLESATKALNAGQWSEAQEKYEAVLRQNPQSFEARLGLAKVELRLDRVPAAEEKLATLREERPEDRNVVLALGELHHKKGSYQDGIKLLKAVLAKDPYDAEVLNGLAVLYRMEGDYSAGEKACAAMLSRHPDDIRALKQLSLIYFDQQKYALAETVATNSLRLTKGGDAELLNSLGMIRVKKGRYPEAVSYFLRAVEIEPGLLSAHLNIGSIALRYRDYDTAARHFAAALKVNPQQPEANLGYGLALSGQQKSDQALAQLQKTLEIDPNAVDAMAEIAMINKVQLSKLDVALEWCGKYLAHEGASQSGAEGMRKECESIKGELDNARAAKAAMEKMREQDASAQQKGKAQAGDG